MGSVESHSDGEMQCESPRKMQEVPEEKTSPIKLAQDHKFKVKTVSDIKFRNSNSFLKTHRI